MLKNSFILLLLMVGIAAADDVGVNPGYLTSVSTGTIVKSAYGECVHNANWQPEYGSDSCGEAPLITTVIDFSESTVELFNFNTITLSDLGKKNLAGFVHQIKTKGTVKKITVAGYTDQVGADVYNQRLSLERALAVKNFLMSQGLDGDTITADGMGPENSSASAACFKKYGTLGLDRINELTAADESNTPEQRRVMDTALTKYAASHRQLISCAAADRRVEITVVQLKHVTVSAE